MPQVCACARWSCAPKSSVLREEDAPVLGGGGDLCQAFKTGLGSIGLPGFLRPDESSVNATASPPELSQSIHFEQVTKVTRSASPARAAPVGGALECARRLWLSLSLWFLADQKWSWVIMAAQRKIHPRAALAQRLRSLKRPTRASSCRFLLLLLRLICSGLAGFRDRAQRPGWIFLPLSH